MIRKVLFASVSILAFAFAAGQGSAPKPTKGYPAVAAIFKAKCVGCHTGASAAGKYDLNTYAKVTGAAKHGKMVIPGKADKSPLMGYLKGTLKPPMPMGGKPLSAAELKTISDWIAKGAKNG